MANPISGSIYEAETAKTAVEYKFSATPFSVRGHITQVLDDLSESLTPTEVQVTLELVLAEILNNIVEHSYANETRGSIVLRVQLEKDFVHVRVSDNGLAMPGHMVPDPPPPNPDVQTEELQEGHFGWYMIRKLCSDLQYVRTEDANTLSVRLAR